MRDAASHSYVVLNLENILTGSMPTLKQNSQGLNPIQTGGAVVY